MDAWPEGIVIGTACELHVQDAVAKLSPRKTEATIYETARFRRPGEGKQYLGSLMTPGRQGTARKTQVRDSGNSGVVETGAATRNAVLSVTDYTKERSKGSSRMKRDEKEEVGGGKW